ncbi:MAG: VWA domain-containing protein [Candidatus Gastranaerophilales bacterium]|nr:VWA domain-containing protein [Candidatus Gastranaerophilales bacterium]
MFKRTVVLGIILVTALYVIKCLVVGFANMELSEFKPVAAIFLLDTSASNKNLQDMQEQTILRIAKRLDSEDHALIYIVTQDTYNIYNGNPHKLQMMKKAMHTRGGMDSTNWGTAYGLALKKAVGDALMYQQEGYKPAIMILGDLENEGDITKQINWNTLPSNIEKTRKYIPDLTLAFLYAHPQKLDEVRQTLLPVIDEKHLIMASEENVDLAVRKFLEAIGR